MDPQTSLERLVDEAQQQFEAHFGRSARTVVAAPGRVNLIGEHTDYNDGFVLPMAIERYVVVAAGRRASESGAASAEESRIFSTGVRQEATIRVRPPVSPGPATWASYAQGAVAGCLDRGLRPDAFDAVIHADVPIGGGLSSSAALEVATATLVEALTGRQIPRLEKALLCQKAEHEYAGMPCGIMDQFSSVMGQQDCLMLLDCRAQRAEMVRLSDPGVVVLIANTNVKHELTGGEYAERRAQCESVARTLDVPALRDADLDQLQQARDQLDDVHFRRARHVITEIERTARAAAAIGRSDWDEVGRLMAASHASLRDDYQVSCQELDLLVELAQSLGPAGGVIGSRMTGGGFGGCTVSLVRAESVPRVRETLHDGYLRQTGTEATIFASRPAQGARVLRGPAASGTNG